VSTIVGGGVGFRCELGKVTAQKVAKAVAKVKVNELGFVWYEV
jgi:hypothetical protein